MPACSFAMPSGKPHRRRGAPVRRRQVNAPKRLGMPDLTPQDIEDKLLAASFERASPAVEALSDPIADTPMVVTLDQLRPYELDPRVTRNPRYDDIKASIRERGLDAPPAITRRPGAPAYIIRNGGNTRVAILREVWGETTDDRLFRIHCLVWTCPVRGG